MANQYVTVKREGDVFTYKHTTDLKPTPVELKDVFKGARGMVGLHREVDAALTFLQSALLARADSGKDLDEFDARGIAALCGFVSSAISSDLDNWHIESGIIEKIADGEVDNA